MHALHDMPLLRGPVVEEEVPRPLPLRLLPRLHRLVAVVIVVRRRPRTTDVAADGETAQSPQKMRQVQLRRS